MAWGARLSGFSRSKKIVVPGKRATRARPGTHSQLLTLKHAGATGLRHNTSLWLWIPAFAGMTAECEARAALQNRRHPSVRRVDRSVLPNKKPGLAAGLSYSNHEM